MHLNNQKDSKHKSFDVEHQVVENYVSGLGVCRVIEFSKTFVPSFPLSLLGSLQVNNIPVLLSLGSE